MRTFFKSFGRARTEKFWVEDVAEQVRLLHAPAPSSVEVWLNGYRMTALQADDLNRQNLQLGPLREGDTIIVQYQPATTV